MMKKMFSRSLYFALALAGTFVIISCSFDKETNLLNPGTDPGKMAEFSFMAQMPEAKAAVTRELGTAAENKIDDIHILVFETTGEFVYKGKAKSVTTSGTNNEFVAFKATLPVGKTYDFMVLTNAESLLSGVSVGTTPAIGKSDVEAIVQQTTNTNSENGKWKPSASIPMWDEQRMQLTSSSTPDAFRLSRMLARINVGFEPATPANDLFQLTTVRYYNYNTSGRVVPVADNMTTGTGGERYATAPSLPTNPGTQLTESLEYTSITNNKVCKNQIYVFEAANKGKYTDNNTNWIDNPCLVVGGKYDADKDGNFDDESVTWYRIDFIKKTPTEQWLSLLRNFSYNVVISSVTGEGYNDPDVALESAPINMEAGVIEWNDIQMGDITVEGTKFLSVGDSRNEGLRKIASLYRNATSTDEIAFTTNIALNQFQMELSENGAEIDLTDAEKAAGMVRKIANEFYEVRILKGDVVNGVNHGKFVFTALKNFATANPVSVLTVTSGRIKYTMSIRQRDAHPQDWGGGGNKGEILGK